MKWIPASERLPTKTGWYIVREIEKYSTYAQTILFNPETDGIDRLRRVPKEVQWLDESLAGVREALEEAVRVLEKCKIIANSTEKQVITRAVEKGKAALGFQD